MMKVIKEQRPAGADVLIMPYGTEYRTEVLSLILHIQNDEAKINLSLEEQPDLQCISESYRTPGGEFWIAIADGHVVGTIGLMTKNNGCAVMKKFFVEQAYRSRHIGEKLYETLLAFAAGKGVRHIILDTPAVFKVSHRFYERAGFRIISKEELPTDYDYPDRDSLLYMLDM